MSLEEDEEAVVAAGEGEERLVVHGRGGGRCHHHAVLEEGDAGEKGVIKNRMMVAPSTMVAELRIGIKHWWKKSTYAYLNEPAVTASVDDNGRSRRAVTYIPQDRCLKVRSAIPASFVIF